MNKLRENIDTLDSKLLDLIGSRMQIAEQIGQIKKEKNVAILQNKRWNEILTKMKSEGDAKGLTSDFIQRFFHAIHQESITHQEKIING